MRSFKTAALALTLALLPAAAQAGPILDLTLAKLDPSTSVDDPTGNGPLAGLNIAVTSVTSGGTTTALSGYVLDFATGPYLSSLTPSIREYGPGGAFDVYRNGVDVFHGTFVGNTDVVDLPGSNSARVEASSMVGTLLATIGTAQAGTVYSADMTSIFTTTPTVNGGFVTDQYGSGNLIASASVPEPGTLMLAGVIGAAFVTRRVLLRRKAA